ncbi:membrane protein [Streptomyces noursei ZPM]|nr:membrane protein [Streptomyces noursei ZPM]
MVPPTMSLNSAAQSLVSLAEAGHEGGQHASLSPYLTGGSALFILLLLLWITTRFNRDR